MEYETIPKLVTLKCSHEVIWLCLKTRTIVFLFCFAIMLSVVVFDISKVVFVFKRVFPLFRQQNDSDLDRQHRMKSEPLNLHISDVFDYLKFSY